MLCAIRRFGIVLVVGLGTSTTLLAQNTDTEPSGLQQRLHALRNQWVSDRDAEPRTQPASRGAGEDWSPDRKLRPQTRARQPINNPYIRSQSQSVRATDADPSATPRSNRLRPTSDRALPAATASDFASVKPVVVEMADASATDIAPSTRRSSRRTTGLVEQNTAQTVGDSIEQAADDPIKVVRSSQSVLRRSRPERTASREPTPVVTSRPTTTPTPAPRSARRKTVTAQPAPTDSSSGGDEILVTRKSPLISVETLGPRKTIVGKESVFKVRVRNLGAETARGVVVQIKTPEWAEVTSARPSQGTADVTTAQEGQPLAWTLDSVASRSTETLTLRIVPRKNEAFDLAVAYSFRPTAAQTMIQVQQPELALKVEGPSEVDFGQTQVYRLNISNPGTGDAENVTIQLMALDGSDKPMATQRIGTIAAGSNKVLEVELTARQAGRIEIRATVTGEPDLKAMAQETVVVRRAALAVEVVAPESKYAGTLAIYKIRIANSGNANAKNIRVVASLPAGAETIESSHGGKVNADGDKISWDIDALDASNEQLVVLKVKLSAAGDNRLAVNAEAHGDLAASAEGLTHVVTLADLKLEVNDPRGPVAINEEMVYEIRIRNRGTKAAHDVEIVAFFSEGVEPVSVKGGKHTIESGQIVFRPIPSLAIDEEVVYKIIAKASLAGNHVFRAEVQCREEQTRLATEETTHFFDNQPVTASRPSNEPTPAVGSRYR